MDNGHTDKGFLQKGVSAFLSSVAAPSCTSLVLIFGFISLWQYQLHREMSYQKERVSAEAERVKLEITETLKQTSRAMQRYTSRIEYLGTKDKAYLDLDSKAYLEQIPILKRIGLVDEKYHVYWSYPHDISRQVEGFDQSQNPKRLEALENARLNKAPSFSKAIQLQSGGLGFLLPVPLYPKAKFSGFAYATIEADQLFHSFVSTKDFQVSIREDNHNIFKSEVAEPVIPNLTQSLELAWGKSKWLIDVIPTQSFFNKGRSALPDFILFFGILTSILLGVFLQNVSSARRKAFADAEGIRLLNLRLGIALDAAKMGAWSLDLRSGQFWRSENHDVIFGYPIPLEVWDRTVFFERVVPEDRGRVMEELTPKEGANTSYIEFRITRFDNKEVRWICVMAHMSFDEGNKPMQVVGIVRDITDEKQGAIDIQSSLELRKAIINASDYAIISTDASGTIRTFNHAATVLLGYEATDVIGKANPGLFHVPEETIKRAKVLSAELGRKVEPGFETFTIKARTLRVADENEWTFIRKDKTRVPVNLSITVLYNFAGEITGYLGIAVDLTEKKKAREQLLLTTERLTRVIDATEEGIWEREYMPGGKIRYLDLQAKKIFGYLPEEEPTYEQVASLIFEDDRQRVGLDLLRHFENKTQGYDIEFRMKGRKDPTKLKWVRARGKILVKGDDVPLLVSTVQDVTSEIEKREQLQKALVTAEEGARAKSEFLANMSHEIRTPLNGVIGMTGLLLDLEMPPTQREYAETIRDSAEILLSLINDILDFSKIEARKLNLESIDFDLDQVTQNIERILDFSAKKKGLKITRWMAPNLPTTILKGDPNRLGQILANLISNAIKFTERGQVEVAISHDVAEGDDVTLRIEVKDTGIGMSEVALKRMFQPFSQADTSMSRRFGGTGLGLSICKHLTEMMGGQIGVRSKEGVGSTFWFTVVLKKGDKSKIFNATDTKARAVDIAAQKVRILLAEDNRVNQLIAVTMLEANGYRVDAVANGNEAVDAVNSVPYDLVLMDCQMPELDGYGATTKIRQNPDPKVAAVPIVAMTANAMAGDREKCLAVGMNHYVTKPINPDELFSVIQQVISKKGAA